MELNFNIFISHDSHDETVAVELKHFLENIFLNATIYVSGRDLKGGQTWIENIKLSLKNSQIIISLISSESINNNWIYFETGAGFIEDKSIPLICDNLSFNDLFPPLSLLQARTLTKPGIEALVKDVANLVNLRVPKNLMGIEGLIEVSDNFFKLRKKEKATVVNKTKAKVQPAAQNNVDTEIKTKYIETKERARQLTVRKIETYRDKFDLPKPDEIESMDLGMLQTLSNAFNIKYPNRAYLTLFIFNVPKKEEPNWIKLNAQKKLEDANSILDGYEKTI
jgi:hypothetical protein